MRKFLTMLLAVLFCTTAMCTYDVFASNNSTSNATKLSKESNETVQNSVQNVKSTVVNNSNGAFSDEEVYLTAQLISHEAKNQAYNGKVAVAEVVLNRVNSTLFPNSIESVIFQNGQFSNIRRVRNINPTDLELRIAYNVLNGSLRVINDEDVMYFRNTKATSGIAASVEKDWGNLDYVTHFGDHAFYSQESAPVLEKSEVPNVNDTVTEKKSSFWEKIPGSLSIAKFFNSKKAAKAEKAAETAAESAEVNAKVEEPAATDVPDTVDSEIEVLNEHIQATVGDVTTVTDVVAKSAADDVDLAKMSVEEVEAYKAAKALETDCSIKYYAHKAVTEGLTEEETLDASAALAEKANNEKAEEEAMNALAEAENTDAAISEEIVNVNAAILMAQADSLKLTVVKSAEDELEEEIDENDPVALARRDALRQEKAEREARERQMEEEKLALANAHEEAVKSDLREVERIAKYNEEVAKATKAAVDKVLASEAK